MQRRIWIQQSSALTTLATVTAVTAVSISSN